MSRYFLLTFYISAIVWSAIGQEEQTEATIGEDGAAPDQNPENIPEGDANGGVDENSNAENAGPVTEPEGGANGGVDDNSNAENSGPVTEPEGGANGGVDGNSGAEHSGRAGSSEGEELWNAWNAIGSSDSDTPWLEKYCPRKITPFFEKVCIVHCWSNGWEGGKCTKLDTCICLWNSLPLNGEGAEQPDKPNKLDKPDKPDHPCKPDKPCGPDKPCVPDKPCGPAGNLCTPTQCSNKHGINAGKFGEALPDLSPTDIDETTETSTGAVETPP